MATNASFRPKAGHIFAALWLLLAVVVGTVALRGKTPDTEWQPFSDQSSHLMATMSLWFDHDLRYTLQDLERFKVQFPAAQGPRSTFLKQNAKGELYYAKPALYALLNAPLYGLLGTNGFIVSNLLIITMMAALTLRITRTIYGEAAAHLMTAALFSMGPFMAWAMVIHPDLLIALLLYGGGYLALTQTSQKRWIAAGLLLGLALSEKPSFAVVIPFLLSALPQLSLRKVGWIVFGCAMGWLLLASINMNQDGHTLAYQGTRFLLSASPFPGEPGWVLPPTKSIGHVFDLNLLLRAFQDNLWLLPSKFFDLFLGRQTGLTLYFPVALLFLLTSVAWANLRSLLILGGLLAYLLLNALAFPSNGFGGMGSYGSRYLMQVLPLLSLALLPLGQERESHDAKPLHRLIGYSAVALTFVFQGSSLPPTPKLVEDPSGFLLSAPASWFPIETSLLPWIPIHVPHFRTDDAVEGSTLFSSDLIAKFADGRAKSQLTLYRHDTQEMLPTVTIHSSVDARVRITPGTGPAWTTSVTQDRGLEIPLPQSFYRRPIFDLIDKKTKQWGTLAVEFQSSSNGPDQPGYVSFDLVQPPRKSPVPQDRLIAFEEFKTHGILPRFYWSPPEHWGSWTDGEYADLVIPTSAMSAAPRSLRVVLQAFVTEQHAQQNVEVFINGEKEGDHTFKTANQSTLDIPLINQVAGKAIIIGFKMKNPISPLELGIGQDSRKLGLGLISLKISSSPASGTSAP